MSPPLSDEMRDRATRVNLWLVDDHEEFRERFGLLLKRGFGFQHIRQFGSAEAAIEALCEDSGPDAVLLDLKLPGMNGAEAVSVIKAKSPATRIFMFATYFDVARSAQALAGGASAFFTKNHSYEDVVAAVCGESVAGLPPWQIASA